MYKDKITIGVNPDYFLEHAEEIINDTENILNPYSIRYLENNSMKKHKRYVEIHMAYQKLKETHQEMWMMFGRGNWFMNPGETDENKALDRVDREYCETTGRWGLFIWGTEEDLEKRRRKAIKEIEKRRKERERE